MMSTTISAISQTRSLEDDTSEPLLVERTVQIYPEAVRTSGTKIGL